MLLDDDEDARGDALEDLDAAADMLSLSDALDFGDSDAQLEGAAESLGLRDADADPDGCSDAVAPVELDGESVKKLAVGDADAPAEADACVALGVLV